ncbi:hypothetical protein L210DRAFT_3421530, partial [Boletus edulis BED1]
LLHFGLFPTAPSQPRMAVSMDLLAFYRSLFERSCDAINALAAALHTHYTRRGFHFVNKAGHSVLDPFRRTLGSAVQWFNVLTVEVDTKIDNAIQRSREIVRHSTPISSSLPSTPSKAADSPTSSDQLAPNASLTCAQVLIQRCPACFGSTKFGKPLDDGGDIHVATDGNFHHRHRRCAGDSSPFYDPSYFLSKQFVDAVGDHIAKQRKRPAKEYHGPVPDEAIDDCESSYDTADGNKKKTATDIYDDTGLMGLICRHDLPLFFANIDSPGEQQKYAVALISHLFSLLLETATVMVFYDIGCVLARTLNKVRRTHWACQLVYNPCLVTGLGLSDGEGTERLWSRLIKLISVERSSSAAAVGHEMRADLGDWIKRRLKRGVQEQGQAAREQVKESGHSIADLKQQWALQKDSQLSIRARTFFS